MRHPLRAFVGLTAALFLCTGCVAQPADPLPQSSLPAAADPMAYREQFEQSWCYRYLEERLRTDYGALYTALTERNDQEEEIELETDGQTQKQAGLRVALPCALSSKEEAQRLYDAFFHDNPQFFYISSVFSLEGYRVGEETRYTHIDLLYTMDASSRAAAAAELETTVQAWLAETPHDTDQFAAELYLHDRLATHCTYHTPAAQTGYSAYPNAYTAYGALVEGQAVCEGYSRAMQLLLRRAGMDCTLVTGASAYNGEAHMWNMVTVNGHNYHLDVTWDGSEQRLRHNYFNMTTAQLLLSHTLDEGQAGIDTCASTQDDYFVRTGMALDTYSRQTIAQAIAERIKAGNETAELRLASDKFDSALLFLKNEMLTRQMVNAYLVDSGQIMQNYVLLGEPQEYILALYKK